MEVDPAVANTFIKYARLVAARGYVHNTLGNIVIRVPHPDFPHGVAYTKHAELSLEEMELEYIVITDIPTSRNLYGSKVTSIGHNLSREILRLRPDIHATIHVHDDALLSFFGSGAYREVKTISLDLPFVLAKPIHYVPAHVDGEADVISRRFGATSRRRCSRNGRGAGRSTAAKRKSRRCTASPNPSSIPSAPSA